MTFEEGVKVERSARDEELDALVPPDARAFCQLSHLLQKSTRPHGASAGSEGHGRAKEEGVLRLPTTDVLSDAGSEEDAGDGEWGGAGGVGGEGEGEGEEPRGAHVAWAEQVAPLSPTGVPRS